MRTMTMTLWALGVLATAAGCSTNANRNVDVGAGHADLTTHPTQLGGLNTPKFQLGDVVVMDAKTHTAWRLMATQVTGQDLTVSPPLLHATEPFATAFDCSFSQSVPKWMQGDVAQSVKEGTVLHVDDYFTKQLKAPLQFAAADDRIAKAMKDALEKNPDAKFFLVSGVTSAEKVYLTYSDASNTLKDGRYQFHVAYPQNEKLGQLAKDLPAFFNTTPLTVNDDNGVARVTKDDSFAENLAGYSYTEEVAAGW